MIVNKISKSNIPKKTLINLLRPVTGDLFQYNEKIYTQLDSGKSLIPSCQLLYGDLGKYSSYKEDNTNICHIYYM